MDLFDLESYFGSHIPVHTGSHSLLRHACCTYAASQLGRAKGAKAAVGGNCSRQARMEVSEGSSVDWEWVGAYHYDKSIALLRDRMRQDQDESRTVNIHLMAQLWEARESAHGSDTPIRSINSDRAMVLLRSDEVIAATAILCGYEFMSATGTAWSRHLNGIKSLLDVTEGSTMPLEVPVLNSVFSSQRRTSSTARKATFWNFARQDYVAACKIFCVCFNPSYQLMGYSHQRVSDTPRH